MGVGVAAPAFLAEEESGFSSSELGRRPGRRREAAGNPPRGQARRRLRVLLVEDDPSMRLVCTVNLEAAGFEVVAATTGSEGVELAASARPDLVLLDVMLPDLGGFEVAERLGDVPIVFLSARASTEDLERGRVVGAIDYVTKPFDPIGLPIRLREDLERLREGGADQVWRSRFGSWPGE